MDARPLGLRGEGYQSYGRWEMDARTLPTGGFGGACRAARSSTYFRHLSSLISRPSRRSIYGIRLPIYLSFFFFVSIVHLHRLHHLHHLHHLFILVRTFLPPLSIRLQQHTAIMRFTTATIISSLVTLVASGNPPQDLTGPGEQFPNAQGTPYRFWHARICKAQPPPSYNEEAIVNTEDKRARFSACIETMKDHRWHRAGHVCDEWVIQMWPRRLWLSATGCLKMCGACAKSMMSTPGHYTSAVTCRERILFAECLMEVSPLNRDLLPHDPEMRRDLLAAGNSTTGALADYGYDYDDDDDAYNITTTTGEDDVENFLPANLTGSADDDADKLSERSFRIRGQSRADY
ncbi:hypothetical protein F4780DRAFT_476540 [Xylariomycetidae sp. FL0641]|nr:hypothetical protein F4780DRAFT_476540 [Xylariomycetidae sp. FL0641]